MYDTGRMTLRPFTGTAADAALVLALDSDPEVMRWINGGRPTTPRTVRERTLPRLARRYACLGGRPGFWAAHRRADGAFLGWFELRPLDAGSAAVLELGYRLTRAAWGHGYATEGARALVEAAFTDLGARRVTANTMAVNTGSRRVMEKAGLRFVRSYTGDWPEAIPGSEHGEVEYALTAPGPAPHPAPAGPDLAPQG
ncbi:GNAT family N-acetyltransferase [Streptomyces harbinensis]